MLPPAITAGLRPDLFPTRCVLTTNRRLLLSLLVLLVLAGFGFRVAGLSAEGLSEDELNKLNAVADYRAHGLTAANGEHPFLMKALETVSIYVAEKWNASGLVAAHSAELRVPVETGLRLPSALFGALTAILIYAVAAELFGAEIALIAAALWAFDPNAIGLNRIAKEDTFLLFFFLLANYFWLCGQRVAEQRTEKKPEPYYWATAAAFGAMLASKYVPHFIAISISYYYVFQGMPETRWRLGKPRILLFFAIMGVAILIFNPTILLPDTWRQMLAFAGNQRIGHDGIEFMGRLYSHRLTDWLRGVPFYFYFVFIAVKLPLLTLAAFIIGVPLAFRRQLGDGRYLLLFWSFYWVLAFILPGGKFTRYFTTVLPVVLITASISIIFLGQLVARWCAALSNRDDLKPYARASLALLVLLASVWASAKAVPHYRLYMNALGGAQHAGDYFPHDEFYDASLRDVISEVATRARSGARVATETPGLAAYYAQQAGRSDLSCISLSDRAALGEMQAGDFVIIARGRRYFSNDALLNAFHQSATPTFSMSLGDVHSVDVYVLDTKTLALIASFAR